MLKKLYSFLLCSVSLLQFEGCLLRWNESAFGISHNPPVAYGDSPLYTRGPLVHTSIQTVRQIRICYNHISILALILSESFAAASSTLFAAWAARRLAGLFLGIISTATAPAAAPTPSVKASPFSCISIPPFTNSMPHKIIANRKHCALSFGKIM